MREPLHFGGNGGIRERRRSPRVSSWKCPVRGSRLRKKKKISVRGEEGSRGASATGECSLVKTLLGHIDHSHIDHSDRCVDALGQWRTSGCRLCRVRHRGKLIKSHVSHSVTRYICDGEYKSSFGRERFGSCVSIEQS